MLPSHFIIQYLILTVTLLCKHYSFFQGGSIQVPVCVFPNLGPFLNQKAFSIAKRRGIGTHMPLRPTDLRVTGAKSRALRSRAIGRRRARDGRLFSSLLASISLAPTTSSLFLYQPTSFLPQAFTQAIPSACRAHC